MAKKNTNNQNANQQDARLDSIKAECQEMVKKRILVSAGVAAVPIPLISLVVDGGVLGSLFEDIRVKFGLQPQPQPIYDPKTEKIQWGEVRNRGANVATALFKRGIFRKSVSSFGGRILVEQIAKYIPLGGQLTAAGITYVTLKKICYDYIDQCYMDAFDAQNIV